MPTNIFGKKIRRPQIDAWVIAFNETGYYVIADEHKNLIKEIRSVYIFDRNERTCCCEITPSYYLIHLYDEVILTDEAYDTLTDEQKEEIDNEYEYSGGEDNNHYVHCYEIDAIIQKRVRFQTYHAGKTGVKYSDTPYEEQMESLREHYNANHCL